MNINDVQRLVLMAVDQWVRTEKTPITQKTIVTLITLDNPIPQSTVKAAVRVLVRKGYIRRAIAFSSGASYVQLRSL